MYFHILDEREVPHIADSNKMLKNIRSCSHYLSNVRTEKKTQL